MSAIFGLIHFDGHPIDPEVLRPALDVLAHRGPDGQGCWHEGSVLLAHWMLHTTPESLHEQQPLIAPEGDLVLVADARIDNRDELLAALGLRSTAERPVTDAELILAAYRRWGADCPDRLIGDFAFAVWDRQHRRLFAARDGMGVRPFYYFHDGRRFAFATLLPAVRLLPEVPQEIDEEMILKFLAREAGAKEQTFYTAIRRLPGGHAMQVDMRGGRVWFYWQPELEELRLRSKAEYAEAFRTAFEEAVRCRLRSTAPVGSQLSGGLDSSAVSCMAAFLLKDQPLHTYSAIFPDLPEERRREMDERAYVEAVHRHYSNIVPHFFRPEFVSPLVNLETILMFYGQPFFASNYHLGWGLSQMACHDRVRVLLNGLDGDSVVSHGWQRLSQLFQEEAWEVFAQEIKAVTDHLNTRPTGIVHRYVAPVLTGWGKRFRWGRLARAIWWLRQQYNLSAFELWRMYGLWPHIPEFAFRRWQQLRGRSQTKLPQLSPKLAAWMQRNSHASVPAPASYAAMHFQGLTQGLWQSALEFGNVLDGLQGIESRMPFFDRRVIELNLRIPLSMKFRQGWPRYVMRVALEGILPPKVQWRATKSNIGFGFYQGLLNHERSRIEALLREPEHLDPFVAPEALRVLWHQAQLPPERNGEADFMLYLVLVLAVWLKQTHLCAPKAHN